MRTSFWKIVVLLQILFVVIFVPAAFTEQLRADKAVDAVVEWDNGKAYFFKGDQYMRYDMQADRV